MKRRLPRGFGPYLVIALATTWLLLFVARVPMSRLDVPYTFAGDAVDKITQVRNVAETGWLFHNDRLGYPFGYDRLDFPRFDSLNYAVMGPIAAVTGQAGLALNLYYIAGFFLIGFAAFYCLRRLGLRDGPAILCALVYGFLPYHVLRGVTHITNGAYFLVPPAMLVLAWLARGDLAIDPSRDRARWLLALAIAVLLPLQTPYNGVFFVALCVVAGAIAIAQSARWRSAIATTVVVLVTAAAFMAEQLPVLVHELHAGAPVEVADRLPIEAENYSLHLNQVLLPTTGHRIDAVAKAKQGFDRALHLDAPFYEVRNQYIGLFGVFGFFALFWSLARAAGARTLAVADPAADREINARIFGMLAIAIVILAVSSGVGNLVAFWVTTKIRAYNRILPFLAFACVFGAGGMLQAMLDRIKRPWLAHVVLSGLGVFALLDVSVGPGFGNRVANVAEYDRDQAYFRSIEQRLGSGAAVFQLPVVWYPEHSPVNAMGDYEEFKPFLMTRTLRFSYGGARGRAGYAWGRSLETLPPVELTSQLHRMGFGAILIDGRAFESDELRGVVDALAQQLPEPPSISTDRRWWLFPLQGCCGGSPAAAIPPGEQPPAYAYDMRGPALDFSTGGTGWQYRDGGWADAEEWGNWSLGTDARMKLRLVPATPGPLLLTMTARALVGPNIPTRHLRVVCNGTTVAEVDYTESNPLQQLHASLPTGLVGSDGMLDIRFETTPLASPYSAGVSIDTRPLGVGLTHLAIAQSNPE